MKRINLILLIAFAFTLFLTSCNKEDIHPNTAVNKTMDQKNFKHIQTKTQYVNPQNPYNTPRSQSQTIQLNLTINSSEWVKDIDYNANHNNCIDYIVDPSGYSLIYDATAQVESMINTAQWNYSSISQVTMISNNAVTILPFVPKDQNTGKRLYLFEFDTDTNNDGQITPADLQNVQFKVDIEFVN